MFTKIHEHETVRVSLIHNTGHKDFSTYVSDGTVVAIPFPDHAGSTDLHGKAKVSYHACAVGVDQDVAAVDVPVHHGRLVATCG